MPNYVYSAKKERLKAVSVVVEATDDDDAASCLGDFAKALGLEGEWSDHFDLDEVIEDDDEEEDCGKCEHAVDEHSVDGGCQAEDCKCKESGTYGEEDDTEPEVIKCDDCGDDVASDEAYDDEDEGGKKVRICGDCANKRDAEEK